MEELAITCQEKTEGNPFYFIQFVTALYKKISFISTMPKGNGAETVKKFKNLINIPLMEINNALIALINLGICVPHSRKARYLLMHEELDVVV